MLLSDLPSDIKTRLESKFVKGDSGSCWPWSGAKNHYGYGKLVYRTKHRKKEVLAHRLQVMFRDGNLEDGVVVMHSCDNPACVNPAHLRQGTIAENNLDAVRKNRNTRGDNHAAAKLTEEKVEIIISGLLSGKSSRYFADLYGVNLSAIYRIVTAPGTSTYRRTWRSVWNKFPEGTRERVMALIFKCKLTKEDVLEIRKKFSSGVSIKQLKLDFNMSLGSIQRIVYGRAWRAV